MKVKDIWYFHASQKESEILQPDFLTPESHVGLCCEFEELNFPVSFHIEAFGKNELMFDKEITVSGSGEEGVLVQQGSYAAVFKFGENTDCEPDRMRVTYECEGKTETFEKACAYYTISGKVVDFDDKPFAAAVMLYRYGFDDAPLMMGVWADRDGKYTIRVPEGCYNAMYADDNSYGKSSLECWGWNIIVDSDETIDLKIGSGEVYSLNVAVSNGGMDTMFLSFRPMVYYKNEEYDALVGEKDFHVVDIAPELSIEDITVSVNGRKAEVISLQKLYETAAGGWCMPMYVAQIRKELYADCLDKQTIILEYDTKDRAKGRACSRGFTQFYFKDGFCTR